MAKLYETRVFKASTGVEMGYLFYKKPGAAGEKLPVVIYLHGADGCGTDPERVAQIESMQNYIDEGKIIPERGMILVSPQCPEGNRWSVRSQEVAELADYICKAESGDENRVSLTGCSLGGMGTFSIAIDHPDRFSCLVPVCAAVDAKSCTVLTKQPLRIFHGTLDKGMGFSVVDANDIINAAGGKSELNMIENWGHEIRWIYYTPEYGVLDWMLSCKRGE